MENVTVDDMGFRSTYEVEIAPDWPPDTSSILHFTRAGGYAWSGLGVGVRTDGSGYWQGLFELGNATLTRLYRGPTESQICVIAGGQGFVTSVCDPAEYTLIPLYPIEGVHRIPGRDVLIFVGYSEIVGFGSSGPLWFTEGVSRDGIEISNVDATHIKGFAKGDEFTRDYPFTINVETGHLAGGLKGVASG